MALLVGEDVCAVPVNDGDRGGELQHALLAQRPAPASQRGVGGELQVHEQRHPPVVYRGPLVRPPRQGAWQHMQDYKSSRCIFNPGNVLTVIDRLTDYILTWLCLLQLLRAPEDELVDAEVLAVDPGAALARLVLVQEPEVPALVLHVTSS